MSPMSQWLKPDETELTNRRNKTLRATIQSQGFSFNKKSPSFIWVTEVTLTAPWYCGRNVGYSNRINVDMY